MPLFRLSPNDVLFPDPELSLPDGLLAIGGDLSTERLLEAYRQGIFPWFNEEDPILWWSPDPRLVLFPEKLHIQRSMRPYFNQGKYQVSMDTEFESVIRSCATTRRKGQSGTWISEQIIEAYVKLHQLGYAHSVEVWHKGELVGGLYGLALGKVFFGESMFSRLPNASKFGFIALTLQLREQNYELIDCQQTTRHLVSLGAEPISRQRFLKYLHKNRNRPTQKGQWKVHNPTWPWKKRE